MKNNILIAGLLAVAILLISLGYPDRDTLKSERPSILFSPSLNLKYFSFGYAENLADSFWLRLIQDSSRCSPDTSIKENHSRDMHDPCMNSWTYVMVNAITELAPRFRQVYSFGGLMLSVLLRDKEGAAQIFEKGVSRFPESWALSYQAGYHYMAEMNQPLKAAELLIQAGKHGAPGWVFSLASKLYTKAGQAFLSKMVLEEALENLVGRDDRFAQYIKERLEAVNETIAKEKEKVRSVKNLPIESPSTNLSLENERQPAQQENKISSSKKKISTNNE